MARRKKQKEFIDVPSMSECEHPSFNYDCVGYSMSRTCTECFKCESIGDTRELAKTCLEKSESQQADFIKAVQRRFPTAGFKSVVEHIGRKRSIAAQQEAMKRLAS